MKLKFNQWADALRQTFNGDSIIRIRVEKGVFRVRHIDETASVMILALQGMDVAYVRNSFAELGIEKLKLREYIKDFILHGIKAEK